MMKLIIAMILCILAGCVETHGTEVKDSALAQFQKGVTTEADVIKALGPPDSRAKSPDDTYVLQYFSMRRTTFPLSGDVNQIPLMNKDIVPDKAEWSSVTLRFTPDGKLIDYRATHDKLTAD